MKYMANFKSDYMTGALPEVMCRLTETNSEATPGYGEDYYCREARRKILDFCGLSDGEVFFLVGGTQTNSTVIDGLLRGHEGVVAADTGHINVHESGAIESCGHKVITLPHHEGKVCAGDLAAYLEEFYSDESHTHMVRPGMVYISHPTELGTMYSRDELDAVSAVCRRYNLRLYLDGARLAYALASEGEGPGIEDIARLCDVFYIGGTKCGALFGEAVVVSRAGVLPDFIPLMKQHGALLAKGRLLGVQFDALFTDGLYLRAGRHALDMARKVREVMARHGVEEWIPSPTNQLFFLMPNALIERLRQRVSFEMWGPRGEEVSAVRFVTDWSTTDEFVRILDEALG